MTSAGLGLAGLGIDWTGFLLAMIIVEVTPGPNMGWLAALSAQQGRKAGFAAIVGITAGLATHLVLAALGVAALIAGHPALYQGLRWAGVAFMLWLAWETWSAKGEASPSKAQGLANLSRGYIANVLNPKSLVFYVVLLPSFMRPDAGSVSFQIWVMGLCHLAISVLVHSGVVLAGANAGRFIDPARPLVRAGLALTLVFIALWIAISTAS
jgi:threonine/homoserine/homoserine lactone efflux protein